MLRLQHQADIQQLCFLIGVFPVGADGAQNGFRCGKLLPVGVKVHTFAVILHALDLIGVAGKQGHLRHDLQALAQDVVKADVVGLVIKGIQHEDAARELVHHIHGSVFHQNVLNEIRRELTRIAQRLLEQVQLVGGGQRAEDQKIGDLFKAEAVLFFASVNDLADVDAAVFQNAVLRDTFAVVDIVTFHAADLGQSGHDAGAVRVAQTALDAVFPKILRIDLAFALDLTAHGFQKLRRNGIKVLGIQSLPSFIYF